METLEHFAFKSSTHKIYYIQNRSRGSSRQWAIYLKGKEHMIYALIDGRFYEESSGSERLLDVGVKSKKIIPCENIKSAKDFFGMMIFFTKPDNNIKFDTSNLQNCEYTAPLVEYISFN